MRGKDVWALGLTTCLNRVVRHAPFLCDGLPIERSAIPFLHHIFRAEQCAAVVGVGKSKQIRKYRAKGDRRSAESGGAIEDMRKVCR